MLWTLDNALACSRYQNFMHRHCDLIEIANRSNLADSFCSGIIQTNNSACSRRRPTMPSSCTPCTRAAIR